MTFDRAERDEVEKRLTMNWLVQGSSQHVGMTLHHLIKDALTAVHPDLPLWYDRLAVFNQLQWWRPVPSMVFGRPARNWRRAGRSPRHPFFGHPLLAVYGGALAEAARARAVERARQKGVWQWPTGFTIQTTMTLSRVRRHERRAPDRVMRAACRAASLAWGIDPSRFRPQLVFRTSGLPPFAPVQEGTTLAGMMLHAAAIGWGGVERDADGTLCVRAVAGNGFFLTKELVKGTAELICLHGLGGLDDAVYERVMRAADRIDAEPAMLQSGAELWRRLLRAIPAGLRPADVLMRLARSSNATVTGVLTGAIEEATDATERVRGLFDGREDGG